MTDKTVRKSVRTKTGDHSSVQYFLLTNDLINKYSILKNI